MDKLEKSQQQLLNEKVELYLDQLGITNPDKRKWMREYAEIHIINEQKELLKENNNVKEDDTNQIKDADWEEIK